MLSFDKLREMNRKRQAMWPGAEKADLPFRVIEVCGEAGEMAEAAKKVIRAQRGIHGSTVDISALSDEMADVVIALDLMAEELGISLGVAVMRKFNKTSDKYGLPVGFEGY